MNSIDLYEKIPEDEKHFPVRLMKTYGITMFGPHWHEHTELLFFTSGKSRMHCGEKNFSVKGGDLIVVNSNELHFKEYSDLAQYYCMILNPSFFSDVGFDNIKIKNFIGGDSFVKKCFNEIFKENDEKKDGYKMAIKSSAYALMRYLWQNYGSSGGEESAGTSASKRLGGALQYISEHYTEKISIADLAGVCYVSEYYFCRFFKNVTGLSAVNYINSLRVEKAMSFLNNTSAGVTEIALKVGFDDVNYFSRVFKKLMGVSPTEYRKIQNTDVLKGDVQKMKANYHTHTYLCGHALGTIREYIEKAVEAGFSELGFSDHSPYIFDNGYVSTMRMTAEQAKDYVGQLNKLREEYKNDITIYIGYEMEYYPKHFEKTYDYVNSLGCDYLILGQHFTNNEYDGDYSGARTSDESILIKYVNQSIEALETGKFIYMAHPDLINFCGDEAVYSEQMRRLCMAAKKCSVPLEINFLGIEDGRHYPCDRFWKIAGECGNDVIFGCDAHSAENVANAAAEKSAAALAEKYNLNVIERMAIKKITCV